MGYPPVSLIVEAPEPPDGGTQLRVEFDSGDRFPATPFTALVWPLQTLPDLGVNAEEMMVTEIHLDTLGLLRAEERISITPGMQIAALRTIDSYDLDEELLMAFDEVAGTVAFQVRSPQGTFYEYEDTSMPFTATQPLTEAGLWYWRALADGDNPGPEHTVFVRFSDVA